MRAGIQQFNADFRGFLFFDEQPGVRVFGKLRSNRWEYNAAYFKLLEKDTNSGLNTFSSRHQQVIIANFYQQDFSRPATPRSSAFITTRTTPACITTTTDFWCAPRRSAAYRPHNIRAAYLGWTGDGQFGRVNVTHAFYQALGTDDFNPIAGRPVTINAQMAAAEVSIDHDWMRFKVSAFYASGDANPRDGRAPVSTPSWTPEFAGGIFSFWNREGIRLTGTGVALTTPDSLLPSLRPNKEEGQANFVNPGIFLVNAGADFDLTPKLKSLLNVNYLRFMHTAPIEVLLFQSPIHNTIGLDYSLGFEYRPPLSENISLRGGAVGAFAGARLSRYLHRQDTVFGICKRAISVLEDGMRSNDRWNDKSSQSDRLRGAGMRSARREHCCWRLAGGACPRMPHARRGRKRQPPRACSARRKPKPTARAPDASPATRRPMSRPCIPAGTVRLGCTDCHGGNADVPRRRVASRQIPPNTNRSSSKRIRSRATRPGGRFGKSRARLHQWLQESAEYVRFVNPGDLRVAPETCGSAGCHASEVRAVSTSMMTTGGMLWGAALYNNGAYPYKDTRFGESYARDGTPQTVQTIPPPTPEETRTQGHAAGNDAARALGDFAARQRPARVRTRRRSQRRNRRTRSARTMPGKPDDKLSTRGFGTQLRTDPVFLGLQKTRLLDPLLSLPGTNDQPGDYRASGCSACHVVYANDRSTRALRPIRAVRQSRATAPRADPTIPRGESGHPIRHAFTRSIPSSQCMVCHVHPGTNMVTTYFGYTWWDNESDGDAMYPKQQRNPTEEEALRDLAAQSRGRGAARAVVRSKVSGGDGQRRSSTPN